MEEVYSSKVFLLWSDRPQIYSILSSILAQDGWQVISLSSSESLCKHNRRGQSSVCLAILELANYSISEIDLKRINEFKSSGHSVFIAFGDDERDSNRIRLNSLISNLGSVFNRDRVIRPNPFKNYHPRDAMLEDFIVNRGLSDAVKKYVENQSDPVIESSELEVGTGSRIIYAGGCTLKVDKPSTIMMTSSKWTIPREQAICSFHIDTNNSHTVTIGSCLMMSDTYIIKEDNKSLVKAIVDFLTDREFCINASDARTTEVPEFVCTPEVNTLIETPISCLQTTEPLPEDISALQNRNMFTLDNSMLPSIIRAYRELEVSQEPLSLIKPNFRRKHPDLEPATHRFLLKRDNFE